MFSVPGWSVSAASLQTEGAKDVKGNTDKPADKAGPNKRKRQSGPSNVNPANVADLWESVIEGKSGKKAKLDEAGGAPTLSRKEKKRANKEAALAKQAENGGDAAVIQGAAAKAGGKSSVKDDVAVPDPTSKESGKESKKDKKKKQKKSKGEEAEDDKQPESPETKKDVNKAAPVTAPAPLPKLTPLQASMREKLISARFRHLNETLYTRPSAEAFGLFEESPEMFQEYHEGFRRQVNVWPENPVDGYIADIKARGRQRQAPKDGGKSGRAGPVAPLLRTNGTCTIADLGCGDAKLAETLQADRKKLNLRVLSYDLQSPSPLVTRADIANLPLEDGSVNVVIFCLALMGTNWPAFIEEAYRILHWKGELWIAEIKSRFAAPAAKKGKPVTHSVGNRKKQQQGKKGGKGDAEDQGANEEALAVEVDGAEARKQETDVSAFVEALRKRGFLLQAQGGRDAVDLSNKMFVKMNFVKAAPALVGKNIVADKEPARGGAKKGAVKFIDAGDSGAVDESSILKPCVYKIR
ncbi:hypothetical protein PFICI_05185 [Pestalotiopsis fici W106-1]|uniref:Ribosomal RNA-processing protein 8 n=1 Tax=Pestalotiopsis fici (strain W106-1 / CGMCC3.15140) TaxID=1229662 RepID=W3XBB4_PESFW|nr:uncharacterized protein PFICI_05185 [Pestalotiopsis fici W106-1]ETS83309.1 hypothetical protein PFICI_05185 [Pestalotiopsis fici W106-1]